jgi:hypothetical protein
MLFKESLLFIRVVESWENGSERFKRKERRPEWEFDSNVCWFTYGVSFYVVMGLIKR